MVQMDGTSRKVMMKRADPVEMAAKLLYTEKIGLGGAAQKE
jgi:hypothetical protein